MYIRGSGVFAMSNLEIVKGMYDAYARRDANAIRNVFHPAIEWIQNDGFPDGGRHVGIDTLMNDVFPRLRTQWENWQVVIDEYLDAGDVIIALGNYHGTYKTTGKSMTAAFAHVYDVRGGRITRYRQYTDTAKVREAMSP
jgi:uncharacterized protein